MPGRREVAVAQLGLDVGVLQLRLTHQGASNQRGELTDLEKAHPLAPPIGG